MASYEAVYSYLLSVHEGDRCYLHGKDNTCLDKYKLGPDTQWRIYTRADQGPDPDLCPGKFMIDCRSNYNSFV